MRACLFALIVVTLQAHAAAGQPVSQGPPAGVTAATSEERPDPGTQLPVSLDKIRKELAETPPAPPAQPLRLGKLPTFKVTVYGPKKMTLPEFKETLKQEWQPVVPGGIHNMEVMNMITPPQARPYGAFVNGDLVQVAVTTLINKLAERAILDGYKAARRGIRHWQEDRIHEEVAAELAAFVMANAQAPPEKKPDEKK